MAPTTNTHRLPDFIIAGAPRAATSWLYILADRHPEIEMAKPMRPEPKFFLIDELFDRGLDYYAATWFDGLRRGRVIGEKSTNYLESPVAAERIHRSLPNVRLVFMLRNPVERAYSNYLWTRRNGLETESFERALALEEARERNLAPELRYARPYAYFSRGLYAEHLGRYFRLFARDRILVLRQEDVASNPRAVAQRFQQFVGVAPMPELADGIGAINAAMPDGSPPLPPDIASNLARRYREPNRAVRRLLGPDFESWDSD
jgi:hypothetical protein